MSIQNRAKLILAGLAAVPAVGMATPDATIQANSYKSPYGEPDHGPSESASLTGLTRHELSEGTALVNELNQVDVVTVKQLNLTKAVPVPYHYNLPTQSDLQAAREKNLERLAKLRAMIEAAR